MPLLAATWTLRPTSTTRGAGRVCMPATCQEAGLQAKRVRSARGRPLPQPDAVTIREMRSPPPDDRERVWADLEEHGYAVVEDALSPDRLDRLRARLIEQAAGELAAGVGYLDPGGRDQRV